MKGQPGTSGAHAGGTEEPASTWTHGARLRCKIDLASQALRDAQALVSEHPSPGKLVPELLARTHFFARSSVPLMQCAMDRARALECADAVAGPLAEYLRAHIEEERGHDEWVLQDLEVLGIAREEILRRHPPASIAAAVGAQYYWILHHHPLALLGYIAVIEGSVASTDAMQQLRAQTGLPAASFRTLLAHAADDVAHEADLDALLDRLPLTAAHHELLWMSAFHSIERLAEAMTEVAR